MYDNHQKLKDNYDLLPSFSAKNSKNGCQLNDSGSLAIHFCKASMLV